MEYYAPAGPGQSHSMNFSRGLWVECQGGTVCVCVCVCGWGGVIYSVHKNKKCIG